VASRMFWSVCDRYLEMIKDRLADDGGRASARWTLWESFRVLLGLFAPFAPFITEHVYQRFYAAREDAGSLHVSRWPAADPTVAIER
jgi:valyl-tRNA synthetase